MLEAFVIVAFTDLLMVVLVSGNDLVSGSAEGILRICVPFLEDGRIWPLYLAANVCLTFVLLLLLSRRSDQLWGMVCFQVRSRNRRALFAAQKRDLYKYLISVILGKVTADIIYVLMPFSAADFSFLLYIESGFILTAALWLELIYILYVCGMKNTYALFLPLVLVMVFLLLLPYTGFSLLSYACIEFKAADIVSKLMIWVILSIVGAVVFKNRDLIGERQ